jgi:hypothetical protein
MSDPIRDRVDENLRHLTSAVERVRRASRLLRTQRPTASDWDCDQESDRDWIGKARP